MSIADIDPDYYSEECSGYWLRSPDWGWRERYETMCEEAVEKGLACWLPGFDPELDLPF